MVSRSKKIVSILTVFVIVFTYMGQTLEAIATTDGLSAITNGFFSSGEMKFNSYFDENGDSKSEKITDVNQKATVIFELSPNDIGKGFLKEGIISSNTLDGSNTNFKFSKIKNITIDQPEENIIPENSNTVYVPEDTKNANTNENNIENNVFDKVEENTVLESSEENNNSVPQGTKNTSTKEDGGLDENENLETENVVAVDSSDDPQQSTSIGLEKNTNTDVITSRSSEPRNDNVEHDRQIDSNDLINEEEVIQNRTEEMTQETYEELTAKDFEIEIINDNQIKVQNVIYPTKIEVEIEYNKKDAVNMADLYKKINLQLKGTFININLERIQIEQNQEVTIGWTYHKDFDIAGEYTQFSPFKLGNHTGIIVENKIKVKREIEDENHLPIKQTTIEVDVPDYNENGPETVNVQSTKLLATKGQDLGEVSFSQDNWNYDSKAKKLIITVTNEENSSTIDGIGEDEYLIVYRYNDYTEDEKVNMDNNFKVTVEEYSADENITTTKEFHQTQEIKTQINDLITYNIRTTEEELSKAKINANYNSQEVNYESEFTTTVNVNILTSDLLEEFKVNSSKETYVDGNKVEFDATRRCLL